MRFAHLGRFAAPLRRLGVAPFAALALAAAALSAAAAPASAERMGLLVPAYQYPTLGTLWSDCALAAPRVPLIAVLNPASGPGAASDPTYVAAAGAVRAAGGRVIGYVATFGGEIPMDSVLREVDRHRAFYPLDGIFLDIMANDASSAHIAWYAALRDSIRARRPDWLVVGNPGTQTLEPYTAGADLLCNFEYFGEGYFAFVPSAWVALYAPTRFAHLAHSLSTADSMRAVVARAARSNAAWVFATHDTMPNPYDATPAYWSALVAAVESTTVPPSALSARPAGRSAALRAWPVPSRGGVRFALRPGAPGRRLMVADVAGRVVRTLVATAAGEAAWDGRDDAGRLAPPGLYFARALAPSGAAGAAVRVVRVE